MIIFFIIYILLVVIAISYYDKKDNRVVFYLGLALILFAGLRGSNVGNDYNTYIEYYESVKLLNFSDSFFVEPSFILIANLAPVIQILMVFYAALSVVLKIQAFGRMSPFLFFSVALWFSHFFLVHEMNQIRASVAIGFLLLSIPSILDRKPLQFFGIVLMATIFHYSAVFFLCAYFLATKELQKTYFFLIPLAYLLNFLGVGLIEILESISISFLHAKVEVYKELQALGLYTKINVYNPIIIIRVSIIYVLLFNTKQLQAKNEFSIILIKLYVISIVSMLLFASLPAFALRISDLFGIVEVLLLPFLFYIVKEKYLVLALIIAFGAIILSLDLFYNKFITSYNW